MRNHRALFLLVTVLVAALATFLLRGETAGQAAPPSAPGEDPRHAAEVTEGSDAASTPRGPGTETRPSRAPDLPIHLALLRERADAGDAKAACQLATALVRCGAAATFAAPHTIEFLRKQEAEFVAKGQQAEADQAAAAQIFALELRQACDGVPDTALSLAPEYLRQAALAGEPEAMLRYAQGDALFFGAERGWRVLREPHFEQWRREAPEMLQAMMESGQPAAVLVMLEAYNGSNRLEMVTTPDNAKALALHQLAWQLFDKRGDLPGAPMQAGISQADRMQAFRAAHVQAKAWHQAYFGGKTFRLAEESQAIAPLLENLQHGIRRTPPGRIPCGDEPRVSP